MYAWNPRKNYKEIWKILIKIIYKKSTFFFWFTSKITGIAGIHAILVKNEIPALRFPHKVPVNPCKHLQCGSQSGCPTSNEKFEQALLVFQYTSLHSRQRSGNLGGKSILTQSKQRWQQSHQNASKQDVRRLPFSKLDFHNRTCIRTVSS